MKLHQPAAHLLIPDSSPAPAALSRTTHLGIGAHPDDLEFMALHGILECRGRLDRWFTGVTCTDGARSPRSGPYAAFSDEEMAATRRDEQDQAARLGEYAAQFQLAHPEITSAGSRAALTGDLLAILNAATPEVIYTHNPADKHPTHLAVTAAVITALRHLPPEQHPRRLLGCEVWRDLDWLPDEAKVALDVSADPDFALRLARVFDSQVRGGKRYDLACDGRRLANATFHHPAATDGTGRLTIALDLTPLLRDPALDPIHFTLSFIDRFHRQVREGLSAVFP